MRSLRRAGIQRRLGWTMTALVLGLPIAISGCYRRLAPPDYVWTCPVGNTLVLALPYRVWGRGYGRAGLPIPYDFARRDYIRIPLGPRAASDREIAYIPYHLLPPLVSVCGTVRLRDSVRIDIELLTHPGAGRPPEWNRYELNGTYRTRECTEGVLPPLLPG